MSLVGIGVRKAETPEIQAEGIINEIEQAGPGYNKAVASAAELVEALSLQIGDEELKKAGLERDIEALLTDTDPTNDVLAHGLEAQVELLEQSIATNQGQLKTAQSDLKERQAERDQFFAQKQQLLMQVQVKLSQAKQAQLTARSARATGSFDAGGIQTRMEKLNETVNGIRAEAAGLKTAASTSPEAAIAKARQTVLNSRIDARIEARRKALAARQAGQAPAKDEAGSDLATWGVAGAAVAAILAFSPRARGYAARAWDAFLSLIGMGVRKAETPEIQAEGIINEIEQAGPGYNKAVASAAELVEALSLQIADEELKKSGLERDIEALLSDSDPTNDALAHGLEAQVELLEQSIATNQGQLKTAQSDLSERQAERDQFFAQKQQLLMQVQVKLSQAKQAQLTARSARATGSFDAGGIQARMDKLNETVNGIRAEAAGLKTAAGTSPEAQIAKARQSVLNSRIDARIEARRKALAARQAGQAPAKDEAGSDLATVGIVAALAAGVLGIAAYVRRWLDSRSAAGSFVAVFRSSIEAIPGVESVAVGSTAWGFPFSPSRGAILRLSDDADLAAVARDLDLVFEESVPLEARYRGRSYRAWRVEGSVRLELVTKPEASAFTGAGSFFY